MEHALDPLLFFVARLFIKTITSSIGDDSKRWGRGRTFSPKTKQQVLLPFVCHGRRFATVGDRCRVFLLSPTNRSHGENVAMREIRDCIAASWLSTDVMIPFLPMLWCAPVASFVSWSLVGSKLQPLYAWTVLVTRLDFRLCSACYFRWSSFDRLVAPLYA